MKKILPRISILLLLAAFVFHGAVLGQHSKGMVLIAKYPTFQQLQNDNPELTEKTYRNQRNAHRTEKMKPIRQRALAFGIAASATFLSGLALGIFILVKTKTDYFRMAFFTLVVFYLVFVFGVTV